MNKRHEELVNAYCSGNITEVEFQEFEEVLRQDPEARKLFLEYRSLDSALRNQADIAVGYQVHQTDLKPEKTVQKTSLFFKVAAVAAILAIAFTGLIILNNEKPVAIAEEKPQQDDGMAVLMSNLNAVWEGKLFQDGDSLPAGKMSLKSGVAEIEFYSGSLIVLEGPAELEVKSVNDAVLHNGQLTAYVPSQAKGFSVKTPEGKIVDLGTSFGVRVNNGVTSVHVFEGEVEVENKVGEKKVLTKETACLIQDALIKDIEFKKDAFTSSGELNERIQVQRKQSFARWQENVIEAKDDKRLIARYNFTKFPETSRLLQNISTDTYEGLNGAIVGARWSQGRWTGKDALDFKRPGDCVRISVPGKFKSVTLMAWIRLDGLDNAFNSLILSNGWRREGALHWQIGKDRFMELAVWNGKSNPNSRARFIVKPSDFGRWMHVAVIYDGNRGVVSHYRNGTLLNEIRLKHVVPIDIAEAQIGNWHPPYESSHEVRNLNGRMDDFSIYGTVLSHSEIQEIYKNSKP